MDADQIVRADMKELIDLDLEGTCIVVRDHGGMYEVHTYFGNYRESLRLRSIL